MGTACLRESPNERVFRCFKKDNARRQNLSYLRQDGGKAFETTSFSNINDQSSVRDLSGLCDQIREARNQFKRKIIDRIESKIFKRLERRRLTRPGETGKNDEFAWLTIVREPLRSFADVLLRAFAGIFFALAETFGGTVAMRKS